MKRKIILFFTVLLMSVFFTGCQNKHDTINIFNKSSFVFDDVIIDTPAGYFYEKHEQFRMDENRVYVTIYFSKQEDSVWKEKTD